MEKSNTEYEINLKDLLFYVLKRWRSIIVFAVLLAVLLGGIKVIPGMNQLKDTAYLKKQQQDYDDSKEVYEAQKRGLEQQIENIQKNLENMNDYQENSILMSISPYNKPVAHAEIYVDAENSDDNENLIKAYTKGILSGEILTELADTYQCEAAYMEELISINSFAKGLVSLNKQYNLQNAKGQTGTEVFFNETSLISIEVTHTDAKVAEEILTKLLENAQNISADFNVQIGKHEIKFINPSVNSVVDLDFAEKQTNLASSRNLLYEGLAETNKKLKELTQPSNGGMTSSGVMKQGMKYTILGGVMGGFLAVFAYCVMFLMSDKVNNGKELRERCGIKVLGSVKTSQRKRIFSGIDQFIDKMHGNHDSLPKDAQFKLIAANVSNLAGDAKKLLLAGTAHEQVISEISGQLKAGIDHVEIVTGKEISKDADTLKALKTCDGVILVEEAGKASYEQIYKEIESVRDTGTKVIGAVLIEQ